MKEEIEKDLTHLKNKGYIPFCRKINKNMKDKYKLQEDGLPLYFTGNLNSNIVTIELNPLYTKDDLLNYSKLRNEIPDYSSYVRFCQNFGSYKYRNNGGVKNFDINWINFLYGFGIEDKSYKADNSIERVITSRNSRLQLDLIPYSSRNFNFNNFDSDYLQKRIRSVLSEINKKKRELIFVTGNQETLSKIFPATINYRKLTLDCGTTPYAGFKQINGQEFCFLSSYKSGPQVGSYRDYGKKARKLLGEVTPS